MILCFDLLTGNMPYLHFCFQHKIKIMKSFFISIACIMITVVAFSQHDTTIIFKVYGVCDALCKPRIEAAAKGRGVQSADWNADTKMLTLVYDPSKTTIEKVQQRILDAGHDVEDKKANDAVYNALPTCCAYRQEDDMHNMQHGS